MPKIIDHVECVACEGAGEVQNETFLSMHPEDRLKLINDPNFELDDGMLNMKPVIKCPFCEDGQAPIYECETCDGDGCSGCEGQGWYQ